jgi:hypothetical protein
MPILNGFGIGYRSNINVFHFQKHAIEENENGFLKKNISVKKFRNFWVGGYIRIKRS